MFYRNRRVTNRHCEQRSGEAIQWLLEKGHWITRQFYDKISDSR